MGNETVLSFLKKIKNRNIREKAIKNHEEDCEDSANAQYYDKVDSIKSAIFYGFDWHESIEGKDFWNSVYDTSTFKYCISDVIEYIKTKY